MSAKPQVEFSQLFLWNNSFNIKCLKTVTESEITMESMEVE